MSSPPPSPLASRPPISPRLSVHSISNAFVKMRQTSDKAKAHHITCTSGSEPITTPSLAEPNSVSLKRIPITHQDQFICMGGVDMKRLIRAARTALYNTAENIGANVLIDEHWSATICGPKHRNDGTFRVNIRYNASAARSERRDARRPVALDQAKGVPGLMTIIKRVE